MLILLYLLLRMCYINSNMKTCFKKKKRQTSSLVRTGRSRFCGSCVIGFVAKLTLCLADIAWGAKCELQSMDVDMPHYRTLFLAALSW